MATQGFDLSVDEDVISLVDYQHGEEFQLKHYVRRPTTSEYKEYRRKISEFKGGFRRFKWEDRGAEAAEWLYEKIIQRVEGYTFKGKNIMSVTKEELEELGNKRGEKYTSWKSLIPIRHKIFVIDKVAGLILEGETEMEESLGESSGNS